MTQLAFTETVEFYRIDASLKLSSKKRSAFGQYMTPAPIGRFMASLFENVHGDVRLLDAGAGVGSLTAAFVERLGTEAKIPQSLHLTCYEIEVLLLDYLRKTLDEAVEQCALSQVPCMTEIRGCDFILDSRYGNQPSMLEVKDKVYAGFTHAILNPPYKKIRSASNHRAALREAGIETSNLYTGFLFLAAQQIVQGGELVAIVPRSFCNGPYFKPFREAFFGMMTLRHIHIFEKRNTAFRGDEVLQENIILHAVKDRERSTVTITASQSSEFEVNAGRGACVSSDMTQRTVNHEAVIRPTDSGKFVHIAANDMEQAVIDRMARFTATLDEIGLSVSTGPIVDFRLKDDLRAELEEGAAPLLYAAHFQGGALQWPKTMKKPNAIRISKDSRRWLWPNKGHYVVARRFTSKEERRRIVASIYRSDLPGELVGFENHLNVFHANQEGIGEHLAVGLHLYLNSSLVDRYFRQFNGHTQVNATDLRWLRYPTREVLERIGKEVATATLSQSDIDIIIERESGKMADKIDPLKAQQKIEQALQILKALGMPKGQHNHRSALTLLALVDLKADGQWDVLKKPLIGITPIMEFAQEYYGREYAPNTRETFRRQTMHQFVEAGIALYNPDLPDRSVNSPKACYQISEESFRVILTFGTDQWEATLATYLEGQETLARKRAEHREMQMIPVTLANELEISLTAGAHSELIKQIIDEFAPRFAPASEVIYVGDAGAKNSYFQADRLSELGVTVDSHGKMPDVVLYLADRNWLLLIESVTSHGPVDPKRHNELATLFKDATPGLVYVTAFPDRGVMRRYLSDISWETEVWCANTPAHLIHFNGERFLGPYENKPGG